MGRENPATVQGAGRPLRSRYRLPSDVCGRLCRVGILGALSKGNVFLGARGIER